MRVYSGNNSDERDLFRAKAVERLMNIFGLTLTCSNNSHTISQNQVNIFLSAMSHIFYFLGARFCCVSLFRIKWRIIEIKSILDRFIE